MLIHKKEECNEQSVVSAEHAAVTRPPLSMSQLRICRISCSKFFNKTVVTHISQGSAWFWYKQNTELLEQLTRPRSPVTLHARLLQKTNLGVHFLTRRAVRESHILIKSSHAFQILSKDIAVVGLINWHVQLVSALVISIVSQTTFK